MGKIIVVLCFTLLAMTLVMACKGPGMSCQSSNECCGMFGCNLWSKMCTGGKPAGVYGSGAWGGPSSWGNPGAWGSPGAWGGPAGWGGWGPGGIWGPGGAPGSDVEWPAKKSTQQPY
ncbi:transcription elongation factor SPT5 [Monomorium pharaonis]|uniref:transcription elongation factor SPT5 n=1 Tax=Monomorium pharaonis TaxID=307658 RepID=UPI00063FD018|nr:transcription elongation factor SPT5 [Monomorium pharaonis]